MSFTLKPASMARRGMATFAPPGSGKTVSETKLIFPPDVALAHLVQRLGGLVVGYPEFLGSHIGIEKRQTGGAKVSLVKSALARAVWAGEQHQVRLLSWPLRATRRLPKSVPASMTGSWLLWLEWETEGYDNTLFKALNNYPIDPSEKHWLLTHLRPLNHTLSQSLKTYRHPTPFNPQSNLLI
jgi:hypothetical protein